MAERVIALVVAAAVLTGAAVGFTVQAESKRYVGRAVRRRPRRTAGREVKIIFSTELVPPSIKVTRSWGTMRARSRSRSWSRTV